MASNEEGEETAPRGNEWEVVSLTQSAYAAAPGPKQVDSNDDNGSSTEYVAETSQAMFMSGHFVFPPSQHENLPLEPDVNEINNEQEGEDAAPELVANEEGKSDFYEGSTETKGSSTPELPGIQFFDEKGNRLSIGAEFEEDAALQRLSLVDKEQSIFGVANYSSYQSEEHMGFSVTTEETNILEESVEPSHQGLESVSSNLPNTKDEDDYDAANLPCQAWWKRRAASLVAHAKDTNALWSIFIAAAVMGLVIIGQKWQQERWQVLQMKWQAGVHNEEMVTHVAKRWVNLARSEGMDTKFIGVDWTTIMFTMEKGRDTTELKKFLLEQEEAYEINIGDQIFRRPGDPPFDEVLEIEEEKSRHSEL